MTNLEELTDVQIIKKINELINGIKGNEFEIDVKTNLRKSDLDSLDLMDLLFGLEDIFGINISSEELEDEKLYIVGKLVDFIKSK